MLYILPCLFIIFSIYFYNHFKTNFEGVTRLSLIFIIILSTFHIFIFNTDAEDAYIGYRYIKNFVEGEGLVFNNFEKVEGYSDFLWLIIIACLHKVSNFNIPDVARFTGVIFSIFTLIKTYTLGKTLTKNNSYGLSATLITGMSGSFACYGMSGLEGPLFALLLLVIIDQTIKEHWFQTGFSLAILTMVRPEGVIMTIPVIIYVIVFFNNPKQLFTIAWKLILSGSILFIPWTIWRFNYYGFLLPNSVVAKSGMDFFYQVKIGSLYTAKFIMNHGELFGVLALSFLLIFKRKNHSTFQFDFLKDRELVLFSSVILIFILTYSLLGGDWMPGYRFYGPFIPIISILPFLIWQKSNWSLGVHYKALVILLVSFFLIQNSIISSSMINAVKIWNNQVSGLSEIGQWFNRRLPNYTSIATFPNGAFTYFNNLPTTDIGGLTDVKIGRFGNKKKTGLPGHIAEDWEYVLSKKVEIIAIMAGQGFENLPCGSSFEGYDCVTFKFNSVQNPLGNFVNIHFRTDVKDYLISLLLAEPNVELH